MSKMKKTGGLLTANPPVIAFHVNNSLLVRLILLLSSPQQIYQHINIIVIAVAFRKHQGFFNRLLRPPVNINIHRGKRSDSTKIFSCFEPPY